jgi:hypothetical protein
MCLCVDYRKRYRGGWVVIRWSEDSQGIKSDWSYKRLEV